MVGRPFGVELLHGSTSFLLTKIFVWEHAHFMQLYRRRRQKPPFSVPFIGLACVFYITVAASFCAAQNWKAAVITLGFADIHLLIDAVVRSKKDGFINR